MKKEKTIVVIPAYNEERTIKDIIKSVTPYCDDVLVVIAKKSTDDTQKIVESMKINYIIDNGIGKGEGMRCAIDHIENGILVFFDADGSHIPKDIPLVVEPIKEGKADMVIASRFLGGSEELHGDFDKYLRMIAAMTIAQLINWRFKTAIMDTQNGFRAIEAKKAKSLNLKSEHTEVETEMCIKCFKKGYKILEVPSMELGRRHGDSSIVLWKHGWKYAYITFKNLFF
jgi:dolichol-phosphate mannosyltransferase|tara:strand:+ start:14160 stop:14843 length:684 start_codon:yes stop_codon:yes gene_type:complete